MNKLTSRQRSIRRKKITQQKQQEQQQQEWQQQLQQIPQQQNLIFNEHQASLFINFFYLFI